MTRKTEKPLVRIVDDDPDQLASLEIMLSAEGWDVACYERASDFFAEDTPRVRAASSSTCACRKSRASKCRRN